MTPIDDLPGNYPTNGEWSTRDELDFLDHLGSYTRGVFLGQRALLLRGYLAALERRSECSFDRVAAKKRALLLLRSIEAGAVR